MDTDRILGVGQLVDLKWKVGVAMSSDICRSLNSSYVAMAIKVADPSGKVTSHKFEMSVQQFQNFSKQLKDIASAMETV
ncbi:COMM domain-containing protein 6-like [Ylistrum balloti]|uniref:COMM domain-containing protein 6-like n=1 Tax=Ylistrum balloti TaxID=509963 RepID=UPI002905BB60|nr:COMM domain-containing protein 6-like [Ylistrum balloti]